MPYREEENGKNRKKTEASDDELERFEGAGQPLDYLGEYIKNRRTHLGMSQVALAEKAGIDERTIRNIETGQTKSPTATVLGPILTVLGEPLDSSGLRAYAAKRRDEVSKAARAMQEDRISNALPDKSKTVSNGKRRSQYAIVAVTALVLVVLAGLVAFKPFALTEQELALKTLQERNVSLSPDSIVQMLRAGDAELLFLATAAGLKPGQIASALSEGASEFFEKSKDNPKATAWLKQALTQGLDPELRVQDDFYNEVSLLYAALSQGNADAALILLEDGASAHGYQDLLGRRTTKPFFLFPAQWVSRTENLTRDEKKSILAAMFENTVAFYMPPHMSAADTPMQTGDGTIIDQRQASEQLYTLTENRPVEVPLNCSFSRKRRVCERATNQNGKDWCAAMDDVPALIFVQDRGLSDVTAVYVQDLISVSGGSSYYFVTHLHGYTSILGMLEVTPDPNIYNLFLHGSMSGHAKGKCEGWTGGSHIHCWQKWPITRTGEAKAIISEYYEAKLIASCELDQPKEIGSD